MNSEMLEALQAVASDKGITVEDMLAAFGPRVDPEVEDPGSMTSWMIPAGLLLVALLGAMVPS